MNEELIDQIRRNLDAKSTEELLQIWQKNDRNEWSGPAFSAIQRILEARGEYPGPQGPPASEDNGTQGEAAQVEQRQRPGCVTAFVILTLVGVLFGMLEVVFDADSGLFWNEGDTIGAVVAVVIAGIYVAVAVGLWRLTNWARIATIVLLGLSMLISAGLLFSGFFSAVIGLLINGYCLYWFAVNKHHFEPATDEA